jgi:DNA-binding NarL/FixJ family response regulator
VVLVCGDAAAVRDATAADGACVVAVTSPLDRRIATGLIDGGAQGVLAVGMAGERLAEAVRAVAAGFIVVPQEVRDARRRPVLTMRQQQILSLVVLGLRNGEIAGRLFLTENTVKTHLAAIYAKLGVNSRKEAVDMVLDPSSGLGPGVLGMTGVRRVGGGYTPPTTGS